MWYMHFKCIHVCLLLNNFASSTHRFKYCLISALLRHKNISFLFQESLLREDKEEEGCSDIKEGTWEKEKRSTWEKGEGRLWSTREKGEGRLRSAWEKKEGGWLVRKKWESRKWRKSLQWRWWRKKSEIDYSSNKDDLVLCFDIELKVKTTEKSQMKSDWYLIQTNMTSWPKANPGAQSFKLKVPTGIQRRKYIAVVLKEKLEMLQWFELLGLECHN